jgi:hypothetical protein
MTSLSETGNFLDPNSKFFLTHRDPMLMLLSALLCIVVAALIATRLSGINNLVTVLTYTIYVLIGFILILLLFEGYRFVHEKITNFKQIKTDIFILKKQMKIMIDNHKDPKLKNELLSITNSVKEYVIIN